jgi:hypothetical protein
MKKSLNEKRDGFNRREWLNKAREMVNFIEQAHRYLRAIINIVYNYQNTIIRNADKVSWLTGAA